LFNFLLEIYSCDYSGQGNISFKSNLALSDKRYLLICTHYFSGWCIRCWEAGVDDGLEWILLTTVKVQDADDALQQIDWYSCRWIIEKYHKCMKTGCAIEKRQL